MIARLLLTIVMASIAAIGAGFAASLSKVAPREQAPAGIVIEQESAGSLSIAMTVDGEDRLIDIAYNGESPLRVSVPDGWERLEVAGGDLTAMTVQEEGLGYVRWSMQPGMRARFGTADAWSALTLRQLSPIALQLHLRRINLQANASKDEVILMMDEEVMLDPK